VRLLTSEVAVKLVSVLRQAGEAPLAELGRVLGATPSSVQRALEILMADDIVTAIGKGRSRRYALNQESPLLDPVERLGDALIGPWEQLKLTGCANPAVELIGVTSTDVLVVLMKRSRAMDQSRAARAVKRLAAEIERQARFLHHEDLRRPRPLNDQIRAALASGLVLVGDLDLSVPDRAHHRRGSATPLGRLNPAVRLPSARTIETLKRRHQVRGLRVFGSAVRSDFRPDSDIDIAVELSPTVQRSPGALESLEQDLERRLGRDVDLVLEHSLHPAVRRLIDHEAVAI
jgi:predicted nucleotidyltransferase/DNA-binding transcriptional ArsR family regulator